MTRPVGAPKPLDDLLTLDERAALSRIGRMGGTSTRDKYGASFYSYLAKKSGDKQKKEKGADYYVNLGQRSGEARRAKRALRDRMRRAGIEAGVGEHDGHGGNEPDSQSDSVPD